MKGRKYGRLTVICRAGKSKDGHITWECNCDCGNQAVVAGSRMRNGYVLSCGCLGPELSRQRIKHGMRNSSEYRVWQAVKRRCLNQDDKDYPRYGGAGIRVCKEWADSFAAFYTHIGPRPSLAYSVDRIDNRGHYEPGNVRWATAFEQQRNRPNTFMWRVKSKTFESSYSAAHHFGVSTMTITRWINGFFDKRRGTYTPPLPNCTREPRYAD